MEKNKDELSFRTIFTTWWPLAASWLLMGIESPLLSAIMARLPDAEINLAAFGGIVFPLMFIIEAPIIMLLSASTALCKDWASYKKINRFMFVTSTLLTTAHILTAFTPLYYFITVRVIGAPSEIIEPGRIGLMIMTPWTFSIAFRRFQQGIMIRFNNSQAVSAGTLVRLGTDIFVSVGGYLVGGISGIVVATLAQAAGVIAEAIYAGIRVRPILENMLKPAPVVEPPLSWKEFARFYIPLALNSFISLIWQPIGSAALSRMNMPLQSLAAWPVVSGLVFMLRSVGLAYNETVVALLDRPYSSNSLKRFSTVLIASVSGVFLLMVATPFARFWFAEVTSLTPQLVAMSVTAFWLSLPIPGLTVLQSWFLGAIINGKRTRGIPEAMVAFLLTALVILMGGVYLNTITGLYVGSVAFSVANAAQTGWLWFRGRPVIRRLAVRDAAPVSYSERLPDTIRDA